MQACELLTQHLTASRAVGSFSTGRSDQRAVLTTAFSKPNKYFPPYAKMGSLKSACVPSVPLIIFPLSTAYVVLEI